LAKSRFIFKADEPMDAKEYREKDFRTPEGSCRTAVCVLTSILVKRAEVPALRTY
jgi:hypothetical protein